jgi:tRNA(Ile2) C34 agmatinyltransferase TiaS
VTATLLAPVPPAQCGGTASLADVVIEAWTTVVAGAPASCPVCAGALEPRWSAGAGVVGGRCADCGTTLE